MQESRQIWIERDRSYRPPPVKLPVSQHIARGVLALCGLLTMTALVITLIF